MNDKQIKHMADRFLAWRLPEDFNPDAGISYKPHKTKYTQNGRMWQPGPTGTNLLTATQAEAMILHITEGLTELEGDNMDKAEAPQKDSERTPQQLKDKYWQEFLAYCSIERLDYRHYNAEDYAYKITPTEINFWKWYRDNKLNK